MRSGVQEVFVHLVREHVGVGAVPHDLRDDRDLLAGEHGAARVVGRVQDDEPRVLVHQRCELVEVRVVVQLAPQRHGDWLCAAEVHHGGVDGEAGVGIDDLGAGLRERQQGEEHDGLGAGGDDHLLPIVLEASALAGIAGHGLPDLRDARSGDVVRVARVEGIDGRGLDVGRRLEVGLADLQVDDLNALGLKRLGPGEDLKCRLRSQPAHAFREFHAASPVDIRCGM